MAEGGTPNDQDRSNFGLQFSLRGYQPSLQINGDSYRSIDHVQQELQRVLRELSPIIDQQSRVNFPTLLGTQQHQQEEDDNRSSSEPVTESHVINIAEEIPQNNSESAADVLRNNTQIRAALATIERYLLLPVILLFKCIIDYKTGILLFAGLLVTFLHTNAIVKREVARQKKRRISSLLFIIFNLSTCIFFVYFLFDEGKIYYSLACLPPRGVITTFWELMWVVVVTDFMLKYITILIKTVLVLLPNFVFSFQKRGKWYLFIEMTSQLYRGFTPIQPWLMYLLDSFDGFAKLFGVLLAAAYLLSKGNELFAKLQAWRLAYRKVLQTLSYGKMPTKEAVNACGGQCPICQDSFHSPVMLPCKHVFCEECLCTWFDRERTCPMCRAQVADDPSWRDGTTTLFIQLC